MDFVCNAIDILYQSSKTAIHSPSEGILRNMPSLVLDIDVEIQRMKKAIREM